MSVLETLLDHNTMLEQWALCTVEDIADDQWAEQPAGLTNHPAWVLGHMTHAIDNVVRLLGGRVDRPGDWGERFGGGSTPSGNRSEYPPREQLISMYTGACEALRDAVRQAGPGVFDEPVQEERIRAFFPTKGRWISHVLMSENAFHIGQLSAWRRAKGMSSVFASEQNMQRLVGSV